MSATELDVEQNGAGDPGAEDGWRIDKAGRAWIPARGRRGRINRQGAETVEEAIARDAIPRDRRPGSRKQTAPRKPPPPKSMDLRELEKIIAEALKTPATIGTIAGDEFIEKHFQIMGPHLARTIVRAAEYNPWLRKKLEKMSGSGGALMEFLTSTGLLMAFAVYIGPPIIYWFDIPLPGRESMGIPTRYVAAPPTPPPAATQAA